MSAEKLNINKTPATLFIGVGGIGSDIVTRVAERCAEGETRNIRFVAMDTNANDLRGVKNSKANIVPIQTSSTQSVLDYLRNDEDARSNWFPNNTTLYPKTVSEGAGQVRAISRLALNATIKTGRISALYKTIDDLFLKDGQDGKQALRVVIVSSAAGGTGSGIAMTVGMLVREYLHKHYREKAAIIRGFLLLPGVMDTVITTETERQSLRRNGYATIKEINAFMIKASGFCNVRKDLERFQGLHIDVPTTAEGVDRLENLPFDFCFLLDRVDQSQESMQTLEQYKEFAAQSLYEQNIGPMQRNAFSMEDNVIKEFANGNNLGRNRFGGIGAAVLRYPYEDVADYIAFSRAMERIGDGESAGDWLKYDKIYRRSLAEFKRKRAVTTGREPTLAETYISELTNDDQRFGVDIKSYLTHDGDVTNSVAESIDLFISAFKSEILSTFVSLPEVMALNATVTGLTKKRDYEGNATYRNKANDNLGSLRAYEAIIKKLAASTAKARAKSLLHNAPSVAAEVQDFHIEKLLKTTKGCMHPNAVRFILYSLRQAMGTEYEEVIKPALVSSVESLAIYSPAANSDKFDVRCRYSKSVERSIDDVCALEKMEPSIFDKMGGYSHLWDALNKHIPGFSNALMTYRDAALNEAAFAVALEYIDRICAEFERFFGSFEAKVVGLAKRKEEIVEKLRFRKGDSIAYVCATEQHLDRLAAMCPEGSDGLLLPDELNADIFEAVKRNAESDRLAMYDPYGENPRTDIFDAVLLGYFRDSVRRDCDEVINLNIIRAIIMDQKFSAYFEADRLTQDGQSVETPYISEDDRMENLRDRIRFGNRLAASGIGCTTFGEARTIEVCSFSAELAELRDIDVKKLLEGLKLSPVATDTVSRYDLRFFNALYNITPDQLSRFRCPETMDIGSAPHTEGAGIYYNAYHEYVQKIGPDSTKCATISLHIDKRWDALSAMPDLSMEDNYRDMVRIHSALVYGCVYGMIKTYQASRYDAQKRVFVLEDNEGDISPLVVSNNTECDEFYEVLDALYHDRASVTNIYAMAEERRRFDEVSNCRYAESGFFKETASFRVGNGHAAPNSLFEIPLMYYNSLPRSMSDENELSIMIDSVISVIEAEVNRFEHNNDRAPFLADRLEAQFRLLVDNFNNDAYNVDGAMRKNTALADNRVIIMALRKVCNKIKDLKVSNHIDRIDALRALIKE